MYETFSFRQVEDDGDEDMAWLSGLAGKAEEVLNTIDRSTAAVLKKDELRPDFDESSGLLEVRSLPPHGDGLTVEEFLRNEAK